MNPMERMRGMVAGTPIDRIALAAWYHMPLLDHNAKDFAEGIVNSCQVMKWDICKLQYHAYYLDSALGNVYVPSTVATSLVGPVTKQAVWHPRMFRDLKVPDMKKGAPARELEVTKRVIDALGGKLPILATIFSPAVTARNVYGHDHQEYFLNAVRYSPEDVHKGLEIISEATLLFVNEALKLGIDGIFFAEGFASTDQMDAATHTEFCKKYDLPILRAVEGKTWFNMLHVHGYKNLRFREYEEFRYPVQAYNWEDRFGNDSEQMSLAEVRKLTDKILMGGIEFWHDFDSPENDREAVKARIKDRLVDSLKQLGPDDRKFVFTPGCSVKMHVPEYRMKLMHEVVAEVTGVA